MRAIYLIASLILFGSSIAQAEYPKPPLEAYGALPLISDAEISPDGSMVAAIANVPEGSKMIVFQENGGVTNSIGVSSIKARDVKFYDNEHVILLVSKTTKLAGLSRGYENGGAFSVNLAKNKVVQMLYRTPELWRNQTGLGQIVGLGSKPDELLMPAYLGEIGFDPEYDLLRTKLGTKSGRRLARGTHDTRDWFVGDGGKVLARERYHNETNEYKVEWRNGNDWDPIFEEESPILPMSITGVMPDESGLVFIQVADREKGYHALMKLGKDGEFHGPLLPVKEREIEMILTDNNRKVVGVRYAGIEPDYAFLDPKLQDSYEKLSAQLPNATIIMDSWSEDRENILYHIFDTGNGDLWIKHVRTSDEIKFIADRRPDVPATALGMMMNIEYAAHDGLMIDSILTVPHDYSPGETGPLPAIMMPHGGPATYDRFQFDWMAQYFANRGYLVIQPNFRGSEGYGRAFEDAGRGEWGGKMQSDLTDGVSALAAANLIDPNRVCIVGVSYGGYAALAGAAFTPDTYQCAIAVAPVTDLNRMLKAQRSQYGSNHWVISYWERITADGDARRAKLKSISPVNFAEDVKIPILLVHGNEDTVVPFEQSKVMERALKRADKSVKLVKLKGEDHWLSGADTRLELLQEMDTFIQTHLPTE